MLLKDSISALLRFNCQQRAQSDSKTYSLKEVDKVIREKYFSNSESAIDEEQYRKQLILLCISNQKEVAAGRVYPVETMINNLKARYSPKAQTLKLLLDRGDISQDEYDKYMANENFSDVNAMKMKAIEGIIRRGDEDMKNGRYMSEEEFIKRAGISLDDEELKDDYDAIRDCEDDIKNGRLYSEEEAIKRIKED